MNTCVEVYSRMVLKSLRNSDLCILLNEAVSGIRFQLCPPDPYLAENE